MHDGGTPADAASAFHDWNNLVAELLVSMLRNEANLVVSLNGKPVRRPARFRVPDESDVLGFPILATDSDLSIVPDRRAANPNPFKLQSFGCSLFWREQLVKLMVEVHREYLTLTAWLPAFHVGERGGPAACGGELGTALRIAQAQLLQFAKPELRWSEICANLLLRDAQPLPEDIAQKKAALEAISVLLYQQLWMRFSDDQLEPFFKERPAVAEKMRSFADFRSVILPSDFPHNVRDALDKQSSIDMARRFKPKEARAIMTKLGTFLEQDSGARAELSGTLFLNKRAIYASSYGSAAERLHFGPGRSARYVMVAQPGTRWQLGRLVERLNILGTYRLAAIRNLSQLNEVSEAIRAVGRDVDVLQRTGRRSPRQENEAFDAINAAFASVADKNIVGGLNYRIERSRYYVESFKRTLPDLRIDRVEGFQPYDEFVRRRYGATWDRISRLGFRHARLQERIEFLANRVLTSQQLVQSREQTKQTQQQVEQTRLQVEQTNQLLNLNMEQVKQTTEQSRQTTAIERQSETQVDLLRTAEVVGIFPVTYYAAGVIGALFTALNIANTGEHGSALAPFLASAYLVWLWKRTNDRAADARKRHPGDVDQARKRDELLAKLRGEQRIVVPLIVGLAALGVVAMSLVNRAPTPASGEALQVRPVHALPPSPAPTPVSSKPVGAASPRGGINEPGTPRRP